MIAKIENINLIRMPFGTLMKLSLIPNWLLTLKKLEHSYIMCLLMHKVII